MLKHFLIFCLLGSFLYSGEKIVLSLLLKAETEANIVHLRQQTLQQLEDQFRMATGRQPTKAELEKSIQAYIDNEILIHEALKLGIHKVDPVVRQRLLLNMDFLEQAGTEAELVERAFSLNMVYTDQVVRRRLIERMEKVIASQMPNEYSEQTLEAYWRDNEELLQQVEQWQLFHVVFDKGRFTQDEIESLHGKWLTGQLTNSALLVLANNQFTQDHLWYTEKNINQLFSPELAENIIRGQQVNAGAMLPLHSSVTGFHLVQVLAKRNRSETNFNQVRAQVEQAYRLDQQAELISKTLEQLRSDYSVVREG